GLATGWHRDVSRESPPRWDHSRSLGARKYRVGAASEPWLAAHIGLRRAGGAGRALYRAVEYQDKRSRAACEAAQRRQPAESDSGALAGDQPAGADPGRADARYRHRRKDRDPKVGAGIGRGG